MSSSNTYTEHADLSSEAAHFSEMWRRKDSRGQQQVAQDPEAAVRPPSRKPSILGRCTHIHVHQNRFAPPPPSRCSLMLAAITCDPKTLWRLTEERYAAKQAAERLRTEKMRDMRRAERERVKREAEGYRYPIFIPLAGYFAEQKVCGC